MCACQPPAVCGSLLQQLATSAHGLRVVLVRLEGGLGIGKLHRVVVHHIPPQQQLQARIGFAFGVAVHQKCAVAYGVTRSRQIAHAIGQGIAVAKGTDMARLLIRRQRTARHAKQWFEEGCGLGLDRRVLPIGQFFLLKPDSGIGIGHLAIRIQQTAQMVGVRMRQQNVLHCSRRYASRFQMGQHLAQLRAKALCSAGVHQQGLRAALHHVGVDGGLQAFRGFWHIVLLQQAVCTRWRNLFELLPGQRDNTVEQRLASGRADTYFAPNGIAAYNARDGKTRLVGLFSGGWPQSAEIAVTSRKGSGIADAITSALNAQIKNGNYGKALERWSLQSEAITESRTNPPGLPRK